MKSVVKDYSKLIAYQKSYELVLLVYRLTSSFPKDELYGLSSQIRRAAVSIPSNIAEGYMRGTKEYIQFLKISLGSTAEVETQLFIGKDLGFIAEDDFEKARQLVKKVLRLLTSYINKIKN